ncbi:MAG TPA: peptide ABC transporter ATP-binding protein, partial [Firmicutes bacterium]|nr:peptide ABC transporter ATP-binding protein [Bacillota bacterium]
MIQPILEIQNLSINFCTEAGVIKAVDGISFGLDQGETLGLVGESGCGKSVTALSILKLIPTPPGRITVDQIRWKERDLTKIPLPDLIKLRGQEISIIFQEPLTSFNPVQRIGVQISEVLKIHSNLSKQALKDAIIQALGKVGIPNPVRQFEAYPHELSGGMRQRAMIAMALICKPQLVIADEPTTALDVTIQAQILELLQDLQAENHMSLLMITHNLGIVAEIAQRVAVMYAGKIVEIASVGEIFKNPMHPYTEGLLRSIPNPLNTGDLYAIPGMIPDPLHLPDGCYFAPRCERAMDVCRLQRPELMTKSAGHSVACWL